jgi:hypothetical protein
MEKGCSSEMLEAINKLQDITRMGCIMFILRHEVIIRKRVSVIPGFSIFLCVGFSAFNVSSVDPFNENLHD